MQRTLLSVIGFLFVFLVNSQPLINISVKKELDSIYLLDQQYREIMNMDMQVKADSLASVFGVNKEILTSHLWKLQLAADSLNIIRVEEIIKQYGYPGKSLVGTPTNEAVFYVIQHSKAIDKYLPLVKQAAENKELPFPLYAMMLDRSLMFKGKEQIYGTQARGFQVVDSTTGKREMKMIIWPIKNPSLVNERRREAGFDQTVEENAKRLGVQYRPLTMEDVNKMQGR